MKGKAARPQGGIPFPEDDRKALEEMSDSSGRKNIKPLTGQPANPGYLNDGVRARGPIARAPSPAGS